MLELTPLKRAHINAMRLALPRTIHAGVAVLEDGKPIGLGAYFLDHASALVVCNIEDAARARLTCAAYKRCLLKAARHVMAEVKKLGVPIEATADPVPYAHEFLTHLGFKPQANGRYLWAGCR